MAKLFNNNSRTPAIPERQRLENRYNASRGNLLLVIVFTLINIVLIFTKSYSYFLFSAFVPYVMVDEGWYWTGRYPSEYYEDGVILSADSFLYTMIAIVAVVLVVYLLCWLFSNKNRVGWLITALVFFALDTVFYVWYCGISVEGIIDLLFHVWVLYYLISGIVAHYKLKKLPPEEETPVAVEEETPVITEE